MNLDKNSLRFRNKSSSKKHNRQTCCRTSSIKIFLLTAVIAGIVALTAWCSWVHFCYFSKNHSSSLHHTPPRYVTVILPSVVNPANRRNRLESIAETWGPAARAIFILHSQDEYDSASGSGIDSPNSYPHAILLPDTITVKDGLPRLYYVLQIIAKRYNPDFTFFVNDHTFVLPHNACKFLQGRIPEEHLYAGHALRNSKDATFNSGAAGYFLSRTSLVDLVKHLDVGKEHCSMEASKWLQGNPGLVTAECLGKSMGVNPVDTRDDEGRHIFHAYGLVRTVRGSVDQWYVNKHNKLHEIFGEDSLYHHQPRKFRDCCASDTVSFHYVESAETVALARTLFTITTREALSSSSAKKLSNDELRDYMQSIWPKGKDVGGYSRELPSTKMIDVWDSVLFVVRNIAQGIIGTPCVV